MPSRHLCTPACAYCQMWAFRHPTVRPATGDTDSCTRRDRCGVSGLPRTSCGPQPGRWGSSGPQSRPCQCLRLALRRLFDSFELIAWPGFGSARSEATDSRSSTRVRRRSSSAMARPLSFWPACAARPSTGRAIRLGFLHCDGSRRPPSGERPDACFHGRMLHRPHPRCDARSPPRAARRRSYCRPGAGAGRRLASSGSGPRC